MSLFPPGASPRVLRPYQEQAISLLRQSLASGRKRPVMQAATGAGKTAVAGAIIRMALAKRRKVAFCVPALSLIDQTVESFGRDGIEEIGVIQANHVLTDWSRPVQVCSNDTLARRGFPKADLVIIDECHRMSKAIHGWMKHPEWQNIPFIGLSATPWAKGMAKHYDDLIVVATTEQLIEQGFLAPFRVFAPAHPDLSEVRTVAGEYHEGDLSKAMDKPLLVADIVETWIRRGEERPTLCFAVDCAHAKHIQQKFEAAGVRCGYMDAYTKPDERAQTRREFHRGNLQVVANVGVMTTGIDWDVRCIIFARPTKSEMLFVQIIGRALRTAPGKADALILDHADNHSRLGFVTDIHHDCLDDGRPNAKAKPRKEALPKECPKCAYLRPPKLRECPACGFKPEPKSSIDTGDGELAEVVRGKGTKLSGPVGTITLRGVVIPLAEFFGMLKRYGREHGYKPGWAANKYREGAETWPNGYQDVPEMPVSFEVFSWLKAAQVRWAKRQAKEASGAQA